MKKLTIILTTAVLFFSASTFAFRSDEIPSRVKTAFEKNFTNSTNVTWEKADNQGNKLYFANFNWNSSDVKAVFNEVGELLSTSRKITVAQLPLKISMAVTKKDKGYLIVNNIVEIISDGQTTYKFNISNGEETISLTSDPDGNLAEDTNK